MMLLPSMYLTRSRWLFACCASVLLFGGCGGDTRNADLAEGETLGAGSYTRVVTVDGRELWNKKKTQGDFPDEARFVARMKG